MKKKKKEISLEKRLQRNKNITVCPICGIGSDWLPLLLADANKYLTKESTLIWEMCENCKKGLNSGVILVCKNKHIVKGTTCNNIICISEKKMQKYVPSIKKGDVLDIHGCPMCTADKKFRILPKK